MLSLASPCLSSPRLSAPSSCINFLPNPIQPYQTLSLPHFSFPFLSLPVRNVQLPQISNQPDPTQPYPTKAGFEGDASVPGRPGERTRSKATSKVGGRPCSLPYPYVPPNTLFRGFARSYIHLASLPLPSLSLSSPVALALAPRSLTQSWPRNSRKSKELNRVMHGTPLQRNLVK